MGSHDPYGRYNARVIVESSGARYVATARLIPLECSTNSTEDRVIAEIEFAALTQTSVLYAAAAAQCARFRYSRVTRFRR